MNKNLGFTLIELLVVVLIIGILSAVALPQYQKAVAKSRYMQLMTAGESIARAEELFYLANGKYTKKFDELDIEFPASSDFTLTLDVRNDGFAAVNSINSKLGLGYVAYFDHHPVAVETGIRQCRVYSSKDTETLHQVCKSLTGNASPSKGNGYTAYLFP